VAFEWAEKVDDGSSIYVKVVGSESMLRLTHDLDVAPAWSPDGRWIAFTRLAKEGRLELRLIAPVGGPERLVTEVHLPQNRVSAHTIDLTKGEKLAAWSPDSRWLAVSDATGQAQASLFLVSIANGQRRRLTSPRERSDDREPAFSPDGRMLAFTRGGALFVLRLTQDLQPQGEAQQVAFGPGNARTPNWIPSGRELLILTEGKFLRVPIAGSAQPEQSTYVGDPAYHGFVLSRDGSRLAYSKSTTDFNIYRLDLLRPGFPAGAAVSFLSSTRTDLAARYSPDGKRIAFTSDRTGTDSIWIANADGSGATPLGEGFLGIWSPDGRRIAFAREADGKSGLYTMSSNGGQADWIAIIDNVDYPELWFTWSQDG
jgi:Tol biopolymer transport system component